MYCTFLTDPHDKFCICICAINNWFCFINSRPPQGRKARGLSVAIDSFEAVFLQHTSYVDTTMLQHIDTEIIAEALADGGRHHGPLTPSLRRKIIAAVNGHDVMAPDERQKVIED